MLVNHMEHDQISVDEDSKRLSLTPYLSSLGTETKVKMEFTLEKGKDYFFEH